MQVGVEVSWGGWGRVCLDGRGSCNHWVKSVWEGREVKTMTITVADEVGGGWAGGLKSGILEELHRDELMVLGVGSIVHLSSS